jgi:hypothetical protein
MSADKTKAKAAYLLRRPTPIFFIVSGIDRDPLVAVGIRRIKESDEKFLRCFGRTRKSRSGGVFDNRVILGKQRFRLLITAPMPVVGPFVIIKSDKRANERTQRFIFRGRRRNHISAMANSAFVSCRAAILTIDDESIPPLSSARTGESDRSRRRTDSEKTTRKCSSYSPSVRYSGI